MWSYTLEHQEALTTLEIHGVIAKPYESVQIDKIFLLADREPALEITRFLPNSETEIISENFNWDFTHGMLENRLKAVEQYPLTVTVCVNFDDGCGGRTCVLLGDPNEDHVDIANYCHQSTVDVWDDMLCDLRKYDEHYARGDDGDYERDLKD